MCCNCEILRERDQAVLELDLCRARRHALELENDRLNEHRIEAARHRDTIARMQAEAEKMRQEIGELRGVIESSLDTVQIKRAITFSKQSAAEMTKALAAIGRVQKKKAAKK